MTRYGPNRKRNASAMRCPRTFITPTCDLGLVDWNAGNIGRLSSKLFSHVPQVGGEDQRGWEWYYLLSLCHQDERTLMHHSGKCLRRLEPGRAPLGVHGLGRGGHGL